MALYRYTSEAARERRMRRRAEQAGALDRARRAATETAAGRASREAEARRAAVRFARMPAVPEDTCGVCFGTGSTAQWVCPGCGGHGRA